MNFHKKDTPKNPDLCEKTTTELGKRKEKQK